MESIRIPPAHAMGFEVTAGQQFHVTDPEGQQVSDLVVFDTERQSERFSSKYTHAQTGRLRITEGDSLYTIHGNPILTIRRDDCGVHDIIHGPGTEWLLVELEDRDEPVQACHENLSEALKPWGIGSVDLFDVMNIFMRSTITDQTYVDVREPDSKPGDTIVFEADRDCVVGLTACASESITNAGEATPIDVSIPEEAEINSNLEV